MTTSQQLTGDPVVTGKRAGPGRLTVTAGVIAREWTKLRSLRSNRWTLAVAAVVTLGLTAVVALGVSSGPASGPDGPPVDALSSSFLAYAEYAVLPAAVLSVLSFTSEYSSGLIRATFTAVPGRRTVLGAKAVVTFAAALVAGELLAFACFFLTQAILAGHQRGLSLAQPGAVRGVLAAGLVLPACTPPAPSRPRSAPSSWCPCCAWPCPPRGTCGPAGSPCCSPPTRR
jgi:ABC-2 type transport system permease protein